jgi:MFS family permease
MLELPILSEIVDGRWRPGIGDPSVVGWLTVLAYLAAAFGCGWAAFREPSTDGRHRKKPVAFWLIFAALMVLLGINKQLDLQSLATEVGRRFLMREALYQDRRGYQIAFIGLVVVTCLSLLVWFLWASRQSFRYRWSALVGMAMILAFVVIRASSFHHVDVLLASTLGGLRWNWILELSGIMVVGASAGRVCLKREVQVPKVPKLANNIFSYYNRIK